MIHNAFISPHGEYIDAENRIRLLEFAPLRELDAISHDDDLQLTVRDAARREIRRRRKLASHPSPSSTLSSQPSTLN